MPFLKRLRAVSFSIHPSIPLPLSVFPSLTLSLYLLLYREIVRGGELTVRARARARACAEDLPGHRGLSLQRCGRRAGAGAYFHLSIRLVLFAQIRKGVVQSGLECLGNLCSIPAP